jgi:type II secretory pathway pseudopilin PulG
MLVVLGIIGILIALVLPAVVGAVNSARRAKIVMEISQLTVGLNTYKETRGEYPPSFGEDYSSSNRNQTAMERHLQRCYPKMSAANKSFFYDNIAPNIDQAEALPFWLSLTTEDPANPFFNFTSTGMSNPRPFKAFYEFDVKRMEPNPTTVPDDPSGNDVNGVSGIDVPVFLAPNARETPYIYMESRTYQRHYQNPPLGVTVPYYNELNGAMAGWMNPKGFQIVCAGLDGNFGGTSTSSYKTFPNDRNGVSNLYDRDNLTNLSNKTVGDSRDQ